MYFRQQWEPQNPLAAAIADLNLTDMTVPVQACLSPAAAPDGDVHLAPA